MSTPNSETPTSPTEAPSPVPSAEERLWAMLAHLLGIPTGFIAPLVIWLVQKDKMPFVDDQGKEALNFQITMLIGYAVSMSLTLFCVGFFLFLAVWIVSLVMSIIAGIRANGGEAYRYPLCLRLVK